MKQHTHLTLKRLSLLLLMSLLALNCWNTKSANAADKDAVTIGVLDESKLSNGYLKYQDAMKVLDQKAQNLDEQLKSRDLLTADEGTKFDTLIVKKDRTTDEQTQLDALIKSGNDRLAELLALSGKATRTDAENARIKELQATLKSNSAPKQNLQNTLLKSLLDEKHATEKMYTDLANKTVIDVANDKHITIVLSKDAVVWNAPNIDITEDVLKQLNKNYTPLPFS
jgi:Skp family chaperone for outer membrane proteins